MPVLHLWTFDVLQTLSWIYSGNRYIPPSLFPYSMKSTIIIHWHGIIVVKYFAWKAPMVIPSPFGHTNTTAIQSPIKRHPSLFNSIWVHHGIMTANHIMQHDFVRGPPICRGKLGLLVVWLREPFWSYHAVGWVLVHTAHLVNPSAQLRDQFTTRHGRTGFTSQ